MVAQGFGFKVDIKFIGVQVDHSCHGSLGYLVVPWLQNYTLVDIVLCSGLFDKPMHGDTGFHSHVRQSLVLYGYLSQLAREFLG